jgi:SAM-dependent methyltransferase
VLDRETRRRSSTAAGVREQDRRLGRPFDHRRYVGGLWDEIGSRQLSYLVEQGLRPDHNLLDVGCGSLRGGVRFVGYLEHGRYFGIDIDEELLAAGRRELEDAGYPAAAATLICDDAFQFERFRCTFDMALAHSVFSHLPLNTIMRCLSEVEKVLVPGGRFYATFFANPGPRLNTKPSQPARGITAYCDADPFYYDADLFRWAVEGSTLTCDVIGAWGHPRNQQMLRFTKVDR